MSTIAYMAAKYSSKIYKEIQGDIPYTDLSGYKKGMLDAIDPYVEDAYIDGAKAVLEELENVINEYDEDDPIITKYIAIVDKIKELKEK